MPTRTAERGLSWKYSAVYYLLYTNNNTQHTTAAPAAEAAQAAAEQATAEAASGVKQHRRTSSLCIRCVAYHQTKQALVQHTPAPAAGSPKPAAPRLFLPLTLLLSVLCMCE